MSTSYQPQPDDSESNNDLIVHESEEQTGERSTVQGEGGAGLDAKTNGRVVEE